MFLTRQRSQWLGFGLNAAARVWQTTKTHDKTPSVCDITGYTALCLCCDTSQCALQAFGLAPFNLWPPVFCIYRSFQDWEQVHRLLQRLCLLLWRYHKERFHLYFNISLRFLFSNSVFLFVMNLLCSHASKVCVHLVATFTFSCAGSVHTVSFTC